ncbi:hydrolase NUDIX family [Alistipes sp. CAG:268]|uniref:hypothetical protein n=1 Tax=Alistipes sp. CAG:268 TaxID=1262693 RepID=UPI00033AF065|nr:hypothetical protein [Alistipes sp. CAG:268]CDC95970.1 hydrolase NUDIX family [Alistipes sp. CAG:268]
MNRIVYFADRAVAFAAAAPGGEWHAVRAADGVTRAKILKILESYNSVAVLSPDPEAAFAAFAAEFTPVEAAGGIVVNGRAGRRHRGDRPGRVADDPPQRPLGPSERTCRGG